MNLTVQCLQRLYIALAMFFYITDAFGSSSGTGHGGNVWNLGLDGIFAKIAVLVDAFLAYRGVDDQLDISVGDHIQNVRASLVKLFHLLHRNTGFMNQIVGTAGSDDAEAIFMEASGDLNDLWFVLAVYRDQNRAFQLNTKQD